MKLAAYPPFRHLTRWKAHVPARFLATRGRRLPGLLALGALAPAAGLLLVAGTGAAQAATAPVTTHPKLLSVDPYTNSYSEHKTEVEPSTSAYGSTIVSAFQVGRVFIGAAANIGWATSVNGGRTWLHGFMPGSTINAKPPGPYARGSDASVAYDARDHQWLVSWLGAPSITSNSVVDVVVSRSHDGIHWTAPVPIAQRNEFLDKNWTVCDNSPASQSYGNCYTEFEDPSENDLIFMSTSTDGGATWDKLTNPAGMPHGLGGQPVVQPGGTVIVPIEVFAGNQVTISSFMSADGGQSWSAPVLIADTDYHTSAANIRNGDVLPSGRTDGAGNVYVVWTDCRFEPSCKANDIVLSSSANGLTWTAPSRIPLDQVGSMVDHFTPGLGVDPATSGGGAHLALGYYYYPQADCTASTCQLDVGYASSTNGGRTWSNSVHVAGPMMVTWLAPTSSGYMAGDYMGTSVLAGAQDAFPVFAVASQPTGSLLHENMYTAAEPVTGGSLSGERAPVQGTAPLAPSAVPPSSTF
jgi:hypothetical protein